MTKVMPDVSIYIEGLDPKIAKDLFGYILELGVPFSFRVSDPSEDLVDEALNANKDASSIQNNWDYVNKELSDKSPVEAVWFSGDNTSFLKVKHVVTSHGGTATYLPNFRTIEILHKATLHTVTPGQWVYFYQEQFDSCVDSYFNQNFTLFKATN